MDAERAVGEDALQMITIITPTADRPAAWPHIERWMAAQTVQPDQWIVADDGINAAPVTKGQEVVRRKRTAEGGASLAMNVLASIPHVRGDVVLVIEDDDYYRKDHIEVCVERLKRHRATGCTWLNYYNLNFRAWRRLRNSCAALCNTAFRADELSHLESAANEALDRGIYHVDRLFWQRVGTDGLHDQETVIGIKGLEGLAGIGIGHRPGRGWISDPRGKKLREWVGNDASVYL